MPSWLRSSGLEVRILIVDERPLEPEVTVEVLGTGEEKTVPIGQISSSQGDAEIYSNADEILRPE